MTLPQSETNGRGSDYPCPLCRHPAAQFYHRDKFRSYYQCVECALVFVPPEYHLSRQAEKAYYDLHENSAEDEGYRRFLSRCATPLLERLVAPSLGLDFGCGPAPVLAQILAQNGHTMATYDLYYQPDESVLSQYYDFIVTTEVVEHLGEPVSVLEVLWQRINPGGVLAIMTKLVASPERFANWHYIRDPTHIVFFSTQTFHWLAQHLGAQVTFLDSDVIFLNKPA
ncbi:class I SAM-dependent methyltransferase [Microbulbifer mangrovi]|uniref:class I SAM-dependent methyltransferase n=1 Tax=Microbulbifer mangrovi TaxID=927787 RepID=UPI00187365E0|nr:class I SAM-dependent methyltransferase [Microbulbifer mangrovi]